MKIKQTLVALVVLVCSVSALFFMQSCSQEDSYNQIKEEINERELYDIFIQSCLTLENNQYILNLTLEEALENGISQELYEDIKEEIKAANEGIILALNDPEIEELIIPNPQSIDIQEAISRLKNNSESSGGGGRFTITRSSLLNDCQTNTLNFNGGKYSKATMKISYGTATVRLSGGGSYYLSSAITTTIDIIPAAPNLLVTICWGDKTSGASQVITVTY